MKLLTEFRIEPEHFTDVIASEHYFDGLQAVVAGNDSNFFAEDANTTVDALGSLMICILVLKNGFTVIGRCNYNDSLEFVEEDVKNIAYDDAIRQIT